MCQRWMTSLVIVLYSAACQQRILLARRRLPGLILLKSSHRKENLPRQRKFSLHQQKRRRHIGLLKSVRHTS
eukprot:scaffold249550_cov19-Tisochrysis_lutea.AAC.2